MSDPIQQSEQSIFYETLGRTLAQWPYVEDAIYHTFRTVIEPKNWVGLASAFHTLVSLPAKLGMIEAAIETTPALKTYLEEWLKLQRKIRKKSSKRARLAHWTVTQSSPPDRKLGRIWMTPPIYDFGALDPEGNKEAVTLKNLQEWAGEFTKLAIEIEDFWRRLSSP